MSRNAAQRRQPAVRPGRRVVGLWQRQTATGQVRYDAQDPPQRPGRPSSSSKQSSSPRRSRRRPVSVCTGPEAAPAPKPAGVTIAELAGALIVDMRSRRFSDALRARVQAVDD